MSLSYQLQINFTTVFSKPEVVLSTCSVHAAAMTRYMELCHLQFLWLPDGIGQAIIFLPCDFYLSIFFFFFFFSSPNLSGHRLEVYHTSTHSVAQCEFRMQVRNVLHGARCKHRTQKSRQKSPSGHHPSDPTTLSG